MLNESNLFKNKKYIIGVSGGPDSMALLDMLHHLDYHLIVCLVNYHKRQDSDLDYEVVKRYCDKHHIPLAYHEVFHYQKGNFQAQARKIRYDFYQETAILYGCEGVILAHHLDDHLETILMQKDRHLDDSLWGISELSEYQGLPVIRPAMQMTKNDLLNYCLDYQIEYRIDSSNLETDYTRNKIRHDVLKHYSDTQKEALLLEARQHNQEILNLNQYCKEWLSKYVEKDQFSLKNLIGEEAKEAIFKAYLMAIEGMDKSRVSSQMVKNGLKAIMGKDGNVKINLPVNFVLIKEYDNIYVTKIKEEHTYHFVIEDEREKDYGYFKIQKEGHDRCGVALKLDDFPLTIRTFKPGDTMVLSYGKKKLSRLFIDAKIPRQQRDLWPVVLNAKGEIILVPKIAKNKSYLLAKPTWFVIQ